MRSFSIGAIALAVGVVLGACGKKDKEAGKDEPAGKVDDKKLEGTELTPDVTTSNHTLDKAKAKVDDVAAVLKEGETLTAELYEKLLLALETCKVMDMSIDWECPAYKALQDARNRSQTLADLGGMSADLGRKLITHASPAVRIEAAGLMASFLGTEGSSQDVIVEAAAKETDPAVLRVMITTVGNDGAKNANVAKMLLGLADHENAEVRTTAVSWIASSWNKEMPGQLDKLAEKARTDPDTKVRQAACKYGGELGDDKFLPVLEELTKDHKTDPALYGECMEGLIAMWCSYPFFENNSEKAYKLLVKRLDVTPRDENTPPWGLFGDVAYLGDKTHDKAVNWLAANKWFKPEAFRKVLGEIIVDPATNWMSRGDALKAALAIGATKKELEGWRKKYAGKEDADSNSYSVKDLDEAIAAAK